jgi:hypothetical protein
MATTARNECRFSLPARIRTGKAYSNEFATKLALIDRIADLRGIETVERTGDAVPSYVDVYLARHSTIPARKKLSPPLLCSLNSKGLTIEGLDDWSLRQVVSNGWGKLIYDSVFVFLPRDANELEVCWSIVRRAYDNLFDSSAPEPGTQIVSTWDRPNFLRTTLQ